MLTSREIRQQFIDYFAQKHAHRFVPSSPVVPHGDSTLLFTNAGMNQFKDVFLATGTRPYTRAVNTQKCIRAGGKHNDLEDVGKDTYHHTFFEMLGNWSFGDYFKQEAIDWAWDLLTGVWGLEPERLHATYFQGDPGDNLDPDAEARDLWLRHLPADRVHPGDKKDNFWEMGDTGPCGPCSELHIDLTPDRSGGRLVNADDPRVIEIWNLVFIQFNRNSAGLLTPLPAQHVDTGMGFERICAVLQGKSSNYDTDVFAPLFEAIREVTGARAYQAKLGDPVDTAYRVLADHARCLTFALTDGAVPSNEGRGYVLRRILRRAVRHGRQTLGVTDPFMHKLVASVVATMGEAFPELKQNPTQVAEIIRDEEESFGRTLDRGIALFEEAAGKGGDRISGDDAFTLYDTYGFPLDLTQLMAGERGMAVDTQGFEKRMEEARERSRAGGGGIDTAASLGDLVQEGRLPETTFTGYDRTEDEITGTAVHLMMHGDGGYARADHASVSQHVAVVLDRTPFYGEAGGQVGDTGELVLPGGRVVVEDTVRVGSVFFHLGVVAEGRIEPAESVAVTARVDADRRARIMANHTATHMMNHKLRAELGEHVQQKGSLVDDQKLRFDFSHHHPLGEQEVGVIQERVNADIDADLPVNWSVVDQDEALEVYSLRAVFGEKYPPRVRVVSIGPKVDELLADKDNRDWYDYSIELCGGTHLPSTGAAGCFVIVSEEGVAKGVRRLTAVTGAAAARARDRAALLREQGRLLHDAPEHELATRVETAYCELDAEPLPLTDRNDLRGALGELSQRVKELDKARGKQRQELAVEQARALAEDSGGGAVVVARLDGVDPEALRSAMDVIRKKRPEAAVLLAGADPDGEKVAVVASVPRPLIDGGLKAGDWVRAVAKVVGGGGGGRPDMAQAGGREPEKIDQALETARAFAAERIGRG